MKKFDCGTIIPDCERVFTGPSDQSVLDQVLHHAAANHRLAEPSVPFIELVLTHTRPVPADGRPHSANQLRLVPDDDRQVQKGPFTTSRLADEAIAEPSAGVATGGLVDAGGAGWAGGSGWVVAGLAVHPQVVRPPEPMMDGTECSNVHPLRRPTRGRSRQGKPHETYRHECLLYAGTNGFLDAVLPFVHDGLARQEPVLVAVTGARLAALRSALGADAELVLFADMATMGHNPARIIPAWREFIDQHGAGRRPVRGIGEPIWASRRPGEIAEAQLHEAMLNLAVSPDMPLWLLCPYDVAELDELVIEEALRSHPVVVEAHSYRGSARYGGAHHLEQIFRAPLAEPHALVTPISLDPAGHDHVRQVLEFAGAAGLRIDCAARLATAIDTLAVAADQDNLDVDIRIWAEPAAVICEVTDPDTVRDPMLGRRLGPAPHLTPSFPVRDRAIRLANDLCDLVQVRSSCAGTVVRVWCWR